MCSAGPLGAFPAATTSTASFQRGTQTMRLGTSASLAQALMQLLAYRLVRSLISFGMLLALCGWLKREGNA